MPTTARQRNGLAKGAPFTPAGSTNSGARNVERSLALAGLNGASVDRYPSQRKPAAGGNAAFSALV